MMRGVRAIALAGSMLLSGCLEFADPTSPFTPDQPAQLQLFVQIVETGQGFPATISVNVQFFPGTDENGRFLQPATEAVQVMDSLLLPDTTTFEGWRSYSRQWSLDKLQIGGTELILRGPYVPAIGEAPPEIRWTLPGHSGPGSFTLPRDRDLLLSLVGQTTPATPAPNFTRWSLDTSGPLGSISLGGVGYPPSSLRLPAELIPAAPTQIAIARLVLDQRVSVARPKYVTNAILQAELRFFVTIGAS
jgi:hypothetical protein